MLNSILLLLALVATVAVQADEGDYFNSTSLNVTFGEHFGKIGISPIDNGTVQLDKRIWLYIDKLVFIQFSPHLYYRSYPLGSLPYTITHIGEKVILTTIVPNFGNFSLTLVFMSPRYLNSDPEVHYSKAAILIKAYVNATNIYPLLEYRIGGDPCTGTKCKLLNSLATIRYASYVLSIYSHNTRLWDAIATTTSLKMFYGSFYYREIGHSSPHTPREAPIPAQSSEESLFSSWLVVVIASIVGLLLLLLVLSASWGPVSRWYSERSGLRPPGDYEAANQMEMDEN